MENKTIEWGWEKGKPSNIRSKEHQDFLIEQYNRNRPIDEQVKTMQEYTKALETNEVKHHIYVNNSRYMEFIDDIATQMTEIAYKGKATIEIQDGLSDGVAIVFTDEAQDYYNERHDEVETMLNRTLNIHTDNDSEL